MRPIDADAMIKFIQDGLNSKDPNKQFGNDAVQIMAEIEFAPTIFPRDWTPCAEGLPDAEELFDIRDSYDLKRYWVTLDYESGNGTTRHVHQLAYAKSYIGFPAVDHVGWMEISGSWFANGKVIAWKYIDPYRADDTTGKVREEK